MHRKLDAKMQKKFQYYFWIVFTLASCEYQVSGPLSLVFCSESVFNSPPFGRIFTQQSRLDVKGPPEVFIKIHLGISDSHLFNSLVPIPRASMQAPYNAKHVDEMFFTPPS